MTPDNLAGGLLDDDTFDPKKLFDEKQYSTLIIDREGFNKKQNEAADLIEGLLDKKNTRAESEEIFTALKEAKAQQLLVDAIGSVKKEEERALLIAACWESGLDFTAHFLFFVELAGSPDFKVAMEAITVLENCEEPLDEAVLNKALDLAQSAKPHHPSLSEELITLIKSRLA